MNILYAIRTIFISGLVLGSLYSIMAVGLSLVWGTLRIYNFTHGSLIMLGAYISWQVIDSTGVMVYAMIICIFSAFFFGAIIEKVLVEPFYAKPGAGLIIVIATLAGMLIIENASQIIWGSRIKSIPILVKGVINFLGTNISLNEILFVFLAPILVILFWFFLKNTKIGLAIRAVEQNIDYSLLLGINVKNVYMITFGISAILAGIAGMLLGSIRFFTPMMGGGFLLKAFVIVILGGLGSMRGTMFAAYLVGILEAASQYYFGLYWTPFFIFIVLIVTLIFRPEGILGGKL